MALPVALQLYTVRDYLEKDFCGTLKIVKQIGYDGVELSGLNGMDPLYVKRALDDAGLLVMSSHVPLKELADTEDAIRRYKAAGCRYMAVPWLPEDLRAPKETFLSVIGQISEMGKKMADHGMTLLYHNHDFEFQKFGGEYKLDLLYRLTDSAYLQTQIDTCWVCYAGEDPARYLRKYAGRAPLVHLKDFHLECPKTGTPYALIGGAEADAQRSFEFRPVGFGDQDMPSILAAAVDGGAEWVIVEQDLSIGRTSIEAARMSREYLRSQGW